MVNKKLLDELYLLDNESFLVKAYEEILSRNADEEGLKLHLDELRNGKSKEEIIWAFVTSREAFAKDVMIRDFNIKSISLEHLVEIGDNDSFVKAVYIALLGRNADPSGMDSFCGALDSGRMDRVDVIIAIKNSAEGKQWGIKVIGLSQLEEKRRLRNILFSIPVFGRINRFMFNLIKVSRMANRGITATGLNLGDIEHQMNELKRNIHIVENRMDTFDNQLCELGGRLDRCTAQNVIYRIAQQQIMQNTACVEYKEYEDKMRGTREEIIERLRIYNAVFLNVKRNVGDKINVLDLGCGRGEWLELSEKEYGAFALGVDLDNSMLSDCKKKGLNAVKADLVSYINNAASNSVSIISMFQVAEHLPINILYEVLHECYRVTCNGGAIIVETPNPENIIVGACNFYFDPTHISKLPPVLLKILVEGIGFKNAEIVRMHEYGAIEVDDNDSVASRQMASFFNNYADYAIIAYKE